MSYVVYDVESTRVVRRVGGEETFKTRAAVLELIRLEPNAVVRYSSPEIDGTYDAEHGSTVIPTLDWPTTARVCPSSTQEGRCGSCRACWDRTIPVIAYVGHGLVMSHRKRRMLREKELDAA